MSEPRTVEDQAEHLYAILQTHHPVGARLQADAMMTAAAALLLSQDGCDGTIAALGHLVERVRAMNAVPVAPEQPRPTDLVGPALAYLRGRPVDDATREARAAAAAAAAFLAEVGAMPAVTMTGPEPLPAGSPEQIACDLVDQLRSLPRGEAHERARGIVAGAGAYLHEVFGRTYASALLAGTLDAAAAYGDEMRGGRDSLDMLH